MFDLTGKTALVTGATGGIGGEIAKALHAAGALKRETFTVPVSDGEAELNLELPPMGTALVTVYL